MCLCACEFFIVCRIETDDHITLYIGFTHRTMSAIVKTNKSNVHDRIWQQTVSKYASEWMRENEHKRRNDRMSNPVQFFYPYSFFMEKLNMLRLHLPFLLIHHKRIITWTLINCYNVARGTIEPRICVCAVELILRNIQFKWVCVLFSALVQPLNQIS